MNNKSVLYVAYFVFVIIIGSLGFYYIGGDQWSWIDSIYMTIITLFIVGFSEVHPLTELGRFWALIVIFFGVAGFEKFAGTRFVCLPKELFRNPFV